MHHVQFAMSWRSTPLFLLRGHVFGHLSSMLCSSCGQCICQIHFLIPAKLKGSHILLKPCSISCAQSFMSAQIFGHILFQMAPRLIEQLCSSELSFAFHSDHLTDLHLSHGPRCEMAGEIFRTPTAKTWHQPYVHRSVHIRRNFKPTSTCPTPPNPMSTVACTSDATSNQRQHAPPHPALCPP